MGHCPGLGINSTASLTLRALLLPREQNHVYLGDKNSLNLTFHAQNVGEGGAYEAELWVTAPPEAEYSGLIRHPGVREDSQMGLRRKLCQRGTKTLPPPTSPPELLQPEL